MKFAGGLAAIGSGFSLGREGPTVQMGASVGRAVADFLRVDETLAGRMVACGAGAGLAAAFHAPLAGFVFAIEELQQELTPVTYAMVLMAAVVADVIVTSVSGQATAFSASGLPAVAAPSLIVFAAVGILSGLFGVLFNIVLLRMMRAGKRSKKPIWLRAAGIGACVGLAAWWLPEIIGTGNDTAAAIFRGDFTNLHDAGLLALIFVGKFCLTILSYVSGLPGGIFAPQLIMGSALGMLLGLGASWILPSSPGLPAACAVMGMAAFFSAVVRTPLTGIVLILEMTGDYAQLLPLLVSGMCAYLISEKFRVRPIYDALLNLDIKLEPAQK